jgi:YesN/AraC family two-component response regulator
MRPDTVARRRQLYQEAVDIIHREYREELALDGLARRLARRLASSRLQLQRAFA